MPSYAEQIRAARAEEKRRKHDAELRAREEREKRIAARKSLANIQRDARAKALLSKAREQEAKNRLKKAKKGVKGDSGPSIGRLLFGKPKKHKGNGW